MAERSNWQLDRRSSQERRQESEEMETQSNRGEEREEVRGDTGRDVQDTQKRVGPHSMVKMQKVGCEVW